MAGDWIKMRGNLWDDPRVAKLCDLTDQPEAAIVGALYWLWATADQHTEDGILPGLTGRAIDRKVGISGFAEGLIAIGWLADHPEGVRIINFEEHNGASAKRRSLDAQRKAGVRKMSASEADKSKTDGGQNAGNCGAREREEYINTLSDSDKPNTDLMQEAKQVIAHLNEKTGRRYEPVDATLKLIRSRVKEFGKDTCLAVIDRKVSQWSGGDMDQYLRPKTLFNATNFANYAADVNKPAVRDWQ